MTSTHLLSYTISLKSNKNYIVTSGVTRNMVIPGPETEAIGESGSGGLGGCVLRKV